jgi:hypothetical protein
MNPFSESNAPRRPYLSPAIVYELPLETKAGSPLPTSGPESIVDPLLGLPPTPSP